MSLGILRTREFASFPRKQEYSESNSPDSGFRRGDDIA